MARRPFPPAAGEASGAWSAAASGAETPAARGAVAGAEIGAYVDAAAALMALPIAEAHHPGVLRFVALAAEMAATLDRVDLGDTLDLAPVYAPPPPRSPG